MDSLKTGEKNLKGNNNRRIIARFIDWFYGISTAYGSFNIEIFFALNVKAVKRTGRNNPFCELKYCFL